MTRLDHTALMAALFLDSIGPALPDLDEGRVHEPVAEGPTLH